MTRIVSKLKAEDHLEGTSGTIHEIRENPWLSSRKRFGCGSAALVPLWLTRPHANAKDCFGGWSARKQGQPHGERGSLPLAALELDLAPVQFHATFHDEQAQAGARHL